MVTLCIDTSTDFGTLAIASDGRVLASEAWKSTARHGEHLFGYIDGALNNARVTRDQIDAVGVSVGPGKFTSLRVGLSAAKGIALALGVPIVGVSALRVLARSPSAPPTTVRVPLMNAYRGDLFAAAYDFDGPERQELLPPTFGRPEVIFDRLREAIGQRSAVACGQGAVTSFDVAQSALSLVQSRAEDVVVAPMAVALVAEATDALATRGTDDLASLEPQYLRPSDATLPDKPLRVAE